ncbi:MAP kinase-activating death domain protein [Fasciola hepatica]|uniref:MAP kinase-activating death domain protein n=1 Tax=Fasciola hepatica TaxID=6192 RepID=A0A4E0RFU6_FASHE|nr:MAP kinase-activating death domain protein [Fasciola hepatica]
MIRGLEQTCTNHGIGGLASAMSLLEICHTHFVELQPDQRKNNNSQMMMDKRGDSKQHEEHFVDNLNSKIGSKIASQMAGIFFKANRLIGASEPKQNQADPKIASEPSKLVRCVTGANDVESESDSASSEGRSNGHQYKHSAKTISNTDSAWSVQKNVRKSRSSGPYRFVNGELISCNEAQTAGVTGTGSVPSSTAGDDSNRVYLYEALVQPKQRSRLWDHMQFWEDTFFDTVAQERDMMGFDQAPMAMLEKFSNLSLTDKRVLQYQEDRLLATCLYNLIACMVLMRVDRNAIRTRVRRIQARCRLGSHFSLVLSHLLDQLEHLEGNAIDLLPSVTRYNCEHTFIVRKANVNGNDDPKLFEIYKNCIVVRDLTGAIADRLDRSSSPGVMLSADERLVVITMKRKCVDAAESYQSDQAKQMYDALKRWLESKPGEPHKS